MRPVGRIHDLCPTGLRLNPLRNQWTAALGTTTGLVLVFAADSGRVVEGAEFHFIGW